eukprot:scaffold11091_cov75-Phaeocystis_antarctica.AAC.9
MLPCDVLEAVFFHLDFRTLSTARSVCSGWAEIGRQDAVVTAAAANTRSKLTRPVIKRGLGLTDAEVRSLPGTAYITRCGYTCWLYGPEAIILGLKLVKSGGRRRLFTRRKKRKPFRSQYRKQSYF